jgi:long-subunit acyl-CoA synthetase (AMP-forming)
VFASGTTGDPTGVIRSGIGLRANIARTQRRTKYTSADVLLPLLPFSHQYGLCRHERRYAKAQGFGWSYRPSQQCCSGPPDASDRG